MRVQPAPRILAVAALCVASLIALVISEGIARESGQEALLPMEAVDPRSLLQGHYVELRLIQRLDPDEPCPQVDGGAEWLAFYRGDRDVLTFAGGAPSREGATQIAPVPVKGTFTCSEPTITVDGSPGTPGSVELDLGINRFHINQSDALRIERVLREQRPGEETRAFAIVSLARDGQARLKGLVVDGERLELNWL
ncbi:MAG TPA: GDYXXLXY domain-containing protein [Candidatus Binatia bacterium]|nr:GDYXXLXY domain-containing protein [Candidatus Binatia bacterium]